MPTNAAARLPQRPCKARAAPMRIALYQPDIPQNTGTILRLSALKRTSSGLLASRPPTAPSAAPGWTISMLP